MAKTPESRIIASTHKEAVGQNLTKARMALGKIQIELARELGIKSNKLNQWEQGIYYPDPWILKRLCEDHGFTMDWFYRGVRSGVSVERADDLKRVEAAGVPAPRVRADPVN
jgi:transcriptional regulator with XRE-family HTH domain